MDYDTWFDYLRLLESEGDFPVIREAYEKAIAQLPPIQVCNFPKGMEVLIVFLLGKTILASLYIFMDQLCFI
jgi:hypothetical protein